MCVWVAEKGEFKPNKIYRQKPENQINQILKLHTYM